MLPLYPRTSPISMGFLTRPAHSGAPVSVEVNRKATAMALGNQTDTCVPPTRHVLGVSKYSEGTQFWGLQLIQNGLDMRPAEDFCLGHGASV